MLSVSIFSLSTASAAVLTDVRIDAALHPTDTNVAHLVVDAADKLKIAHLHFALRVQYHSPFVNLVYPYTKVQVLVRRDVHSSNRRQTCLKCQ